MGEVNVLVVDDEPSMLGYLRTTLELKSYRVATAASGAEALDAVIRGPVPDVVLLDLVMPDLDGLETLERLQHLRPGLKVIMLSCVSATPKVVAAMRLGAQDYLTKPFHQSELELALQRCLTGHNNGASEAPACEREELDADRFFIAASPAMRNVYAQAR